MGRPVWVGVAILMDDGTTQAWQMNAADSPIEIRTEQAGIAPRPGPSWTWNLNDLLVHTKIIITGRARRWGPQAGSGSAFIMPSKEIEQ